MGEKPREDIVENEECTQQVNNADETKLVGIVYSVGDKYVMGFWADWLTFKLIIDLLR